MEKMPKKPKTVLEYLNWIYFYFCVSTGLWMLDAWERAIFNTGAIIIFAMSAYTAYAFLPGHLYAMLTYFGMMPAHNVEIM